MSGEVVVVAERLAYVRGALEVCLERKLADDIVAEVCADLKITADELQEAAKAWKVVK